jgi:hypothetical protein
VSPNVKLQSSCGWFIDESCEPKALLISKAAQNHEVKGVGMGLGAHAAQDCNAMPCSHQPEVVVMVIELSRHQRPIRCRAAFSRISVNSLELFLADSFRIFNKKKTKSSSSRVGSR